MPAASSEISPPPSGWMHANANAHAARAPDRLPPLSGHPPCESLCHREAVHPIGLCSCFPREASTRGQGTTAADIPLRSTKHELHPKLYKKTPCALSPHSIKRRAHAIMPKAA